MPDSWEEELLANMRRKAEAASRARADAGSHSSDADGDDDADYVDDVEEPDDDVAEFDDVEVTRLKDAGQTRMFNNQAAKEEAVVERRATAAFKRTEGPPDASRAWLSSPRMTRSEVSLRLALYLLKERLVASDVTVALTGDEMTVKQHRPIFPVVEFLAGHDCEKGDPDPRKWCDTYAVEGAARALVLCEKAKEAPLLAELASGSRLLVDVMGGPTDPTRSSREHTQLRTAIGRAITLDDVRKADVLAVAMPRSKRFRQLALQWRDAPRLVAAGLRLVWVDRAGNVEGLRGIRGRTKDG